jgi:hypothetical protein
MSRLKGFHVGQLADELELLKPDLLIYKRAVSAVHVAC